MYWTKMRLNGLTALDLPKVGALPTDKFIFQGADGLGPPEIDVSIANTRNQGGVYQGRRPRNKEIVAQIGLNPDWDTGQTAADLRDEIYGLLTPGFFDFVTIQLMNDDDVLVQTIGYVSKCEVAPFTKDPAVQVTFPTTSPYLVAPDLLDLDVSDIDKEFPEIVNPGSAGVGFFLSVTLTDDMAGWGIDNGAAEFLPGRKEMFVDYALLEDDVLSFDTRPGSRSVKVYRVVVGVPTMINIVDSLTVTSEWLLLPGGTNTLHTSDTSFDWESIQFTPQYWGV